MRNFQLSIARSSWLIAHSKNNKILPQKYYVFQKGYNIYLCEKYYLCQVNKILFYEEIFITYLIDNIGF